MTRTITRAFICFLLLLAVVAAIGGMYLVTTAFADDVSASASGTDTGTTTVESSSSGDAGSSTQTDPTAEPDSVLTPDTTEVPSTGSDAQNTPGPDASASDADDTASPTPTATEIPLTPEELQACDLNGDSRVNIADALSLFRFVNGQLTVTDFGTDGNGSLKGDFNKDGLLNITDALKLFRYVNGQISSL